MKPSTYKWICTGCGRTLQPYDLTRVGIGVHHRNPDTDTTDGLLNCGPVRQVPDHVASGEGGTGES